MNFITPVLYGTIVVLIAAGMVSCLRSDILIGQKILWMVVILSFPIAGSLFFWIFSDAANGGDCRRL